MSGWREGDQGRMIGGKGIIDKGIRDVWMKGNGLVPSSLEGGDKCCLVGGERIRDAWLERRGSEMSGWRDGDD